MPRSSVRGKLASPLLRAREELRRRRIDLVGESSWMAVPRLRHFRGVKLLQVREPIAVIRSFTGMKFFEHDGTRSETGFERYARHYVPLSGDPLTDAMQWWITWNQLAAKSATMTYRLRDLDEELFAAILDLIGVPDAEARAQAALSTVSPTNTSEQRGTRRPDVSWDTLPNGAVKDRLRDAAAGFGYNLP
jgi:hypothetical protein